MKYQINVKLFSVHCFFYHLVRWFVCLYGCDFALQFAAQWKFNLNIVDLVSQCFLYCSMCTVCKINFKCKWSFQAFHTVKNYVEYVHEDANKKLTLQNFNLFITTKRKLRKSNFYTHFINNMVSFLLKWNQCTEV